MLRNVFAAGLSFMYVLILRVRKMFKLDQDMFTLIRFWVTDIPPPFRFLI